MNKSLLQYIGIAFFLIVAVLLIAFGLSLISSPPPTEPALVPTIAQQAALPASPSPIEVTTTMPALSPTPAATPVSPEATIPPQSTLTPKPSPTTITAPATPQSYVVQDGETVSTIAFKFGITQEALQLANGITIPELLQVGQELIIPTDSENAGIANTNATSTPSSSEATEPGNANIETIGFSRGGRTINSYNFGNGSIHLAFVGGIHGGYEWNTVILAREAIAYFSSNPSKIPVSVTLHIIPNANPDGVYYATRTEGAFTAADVIDDSVQGRFNGQNVDLNRNWGCNWSAEAQWRDEPVNAGNEPFSEPENRFMRDFFLRENMQSVLFWHSAAGIVSPGVCNGDHQPSIIQANAYGNASGYTVAPFTAYAITGDASDWLVLQDIPSFSVELTNHVDIEWERNIAGMLAILALFA